MTVYPTLLAGQKVTADLLTTMLPMHAAKTSSTSRASTTAVSADPDLVIAMEANAEYILTGYFRISGDPAADMDIMLSVPSGTTGSYAVTGRLAGTSAADTDTRTSTRISFNVETQYSTPSTSAAQANNLIGRVKVGSTAGNLEVHWAQTVSNATASVFESDSFIELRRIS